MNRPSLQQTLRHGLLVAVMVAVLAAGGLLTGLGTVMLRQQAADNLQMAARAAGYTVEPAMVFHDGDEMFEALALIAGSEDIAEASVFDLDGQLLSHWSRRTDSRWAGPEDWLAGWLLPPAADHPVLHDGAPIGRVRMRGAGRGLLGFVLGGIGAILACLLLSALLAAVVMQRVIGRILLPLGQLAAVLRGARAERALDLRVPAAGIDEFHRLGEDANTLLAELASRQQHLQRENDHLAHRASHDSLTGLHNRATFEQALALAVASAAATEGQLALLFVDADHFKQINDERGHDAGDRVLVAIGRRIRAQVRDQDVVARLGGDEFAVLLDGLRGARDAQRIAAAIEAGMREPVTLDQDTSVEATLSIGVALFPQDASDAAGLLRAADRAMYRGKRLRPPRRGPAARPAG
ncbi:diguanylate cyclase [Xylophilus sp. Kf1]|nr:diguanylate cyclase [Xylophilus sp. Kf1]